MVQRRSQKRKASDDVITNTATAAELDAATCGTLSSPGNDGVESMAVFNFKSPSSDVSIDDSSPSIPSVCFYKNCVKQKEKNVLSSTENIANEIDKKSADGKTPCKRLRPACVPEEVPSLLWKSKLPRIPVAAKTPKLEAVKCVKGRSPMTADIIHASTPGQVKKSSVFCDIDDIVSAVTSDSPVRKCASDTSDSENDESAAAVLKKKPRKELFSGAKFSSDGKRSSAFYSGVLSPRKKNASSASGGSSGRRFFKHRASLSDSEAGRNMVKGASLSVGKGFNLKFTPLGKKQVASKEKHLKSKSARKAVRMSQFKPLKFVSDDAQSKENVDCPSLVAKEDNGEGKVLKIAVPAPPTDGAVAQNDADHCAKSSPIVEKSSEVLKLENDTVPDNVTESEQTSQFSADLFSSAASASSNVSSVDQIIDGFGFDGEDANNKEAVDKCTREQHIPSRHDDGDDDIDGSDKWSTQPACSSASDTVSSMADFGTEQDISDGSDTPTPSKLFPIFTRSPKQSQDSPAMQVKAVSPKVPGKPSPLSVKNRLKDKENGIEQYSLDFGQKPLGTKQCGICGMVYSQNEPTDEAHHSKFHQRLLKALKLPKVKKDRIVQEFPNGSCIILMSPNDKFEQKKVEAILSVVDEDLGFSEVVPRVMAHKKIYLYISEEKKVVGCCVAEAIEQAYPVLTDSQRTTQLSDPQRQRAWCCSTEAVPAKCGVSRIWVFRHERRKGIATRLLGCVRYNFFLGKPLEKSEMAFTDPTPDGREFAANFSGMPNFLVYK